MSYKTILASLLILPLLILPLSGCDTSYGSPTSSSPSASVTLETPTSSPGNIEPSPTKPPPFPEALNDPWKEFIVGSDIIVLGTITDNENEVVTVEQRNNTGKYAYTIYTLAIEKVIKGEPDTKEVSIKEPGGKIDEKITQITEGAHHFSISDQVLVCLHKGDNNTYTISQEDILWIKYSQGGGTAVKLDDIIGRTIKILLAHSIPITLPHKEWPPIPADTVQLPEGVILSTIPVNTPLPNDSPTVPPVSTSTSQ